MIEIVKLNAIYPNPQPPDVLKVRASVWMEDLGYLSEEMFLSSIRLHRKASKFFPTPADIIEAYNEIVRFAPKPLSLPEARLVFTSEEEAEWKELIKKFRKNRGK